MKKQVVMTAPSRVKVGTYLTPKGKRLKEEGASDEVLAKYTKNRYKPNPESKPIKFKEITPDGKVSTSTKTIVHTGFKTPDGISEPEIQDEEE